MKTKNGLLAICFIIFFFIAVNLIPKSNKFYYAFENYKKTIDSPISGTVKRIILGKNFFGAQFGSDSNNYYRFTYQVERTPKQWLEKYPEDFIIVGDSVMKTANNDTFLVIRKLNRWKYVLPKALIPGN